MAGEGASRVLVVCASAVRGRAVVRALARAGRFALPCASLEQARGIAGERDVLLIEADALPFALGARPSVAAVVALHEEDAGEPWSSLAAGADEYVRWRPGRPFPADRIDAARARAAQVPQAPEHVLARVSHELRAPIGGVIGLCDLLLGTPLDDEQRDHVATARLSAEALLGLTDRIVDWARMRAGRCEIEKGPFGVRDLVEDVCTLLAPQAHEKGLELNCHVPPGMPDECVSDAARVRQILVNLVTNAIKYTRRGRVDVHAAIEEGDGEATLLLEVCDTGAGISPEESDRLFRPFSQVGDAPAARQGVGLGL